MTPRQQRGVTLVELIVTLAIVAMLVFAAAPTFTGAILNSRVRGTAEAILSGIQLVRSEAVSRNARVRFQLTDTLDGRCVASAAGTNWVINLDPDADPTEVEGKCDSAPYDDSAPELQVSPFILQTRPAAGHAGAVVAACRPK